MLLFFFSLLWWEKSFSYMTKNKIKMDENLMPWNIYSVLIIKYKLSIKLNISSKQRRLIWTNIFFLLLFICFHSFCCLFIKPIITSLRLIYFIKFTIIFLKLPYYIPLLLLFRICWMCLFTSVQKIKSLKKSLSPYFCLNKRIDI